MRVLLLFNAVFLLTISCNKTIPIDSDPDSRITTRYLDKDRKDLICGNCNDLESVMSPIISLHIYDRKCLIPDKILVSPTMEELSIVSMNLSFQMEPNLPSLKKLFIYDNVFSSIPNFIMRQKGVKELLLFLENEDSVKDEIQKLEKLESLTLYFNHLDSFPLEVLKLKHLRKLKIETLDNSAVDIPEGLYKMKNLKEIEISSSTES